MIDEPLFSDGTGSLYYAPRADGTADVRVRLRFPVPGVRTSTRTNASPSFVRQVAEVKTSAWTIDELVRGTPHSDFGKELIRCLSAYVAPDDVAGRPILDFGCGSGASLVHLSRAYASAAAITGVEFNEAFLTLARERIAALGDARVAIVQQRDSISLPDFVSPRFIVLSAVVEHMLPAERRVLLPLLWKRLQPGGMLFIGDTPHAWFPREAHTTGMWGLNYQSDETAFRRVRAARRSDLPEEWPDLLRAGIRGSTEREMIQLLSLGGSEPRIMRPLYPCPRRRADLWFEGLSERRRLLKRAARELLHAGESVTGSLLTQNVCICFKKPEGDRKH